MEKGDFCFKQFAVRQDRCAMKVGTDGVLLGAWALCSSESDILDIGAGTGLLALMMAQRFPLSRVTALELDADAALQAAENVSRSPFADRIRVVQGDVRDFQGRWGCIVCNPPFFSEDICSPHDGRHLARSAHSLSFADLWGAVVRLLLPGGLFNVILPVREFPDFHHHSLTHGFCLIRSTEVKTTPNKPPKRLLLTYCMGEATAEARTTLALTAPDGGRSKDYQALTEDFYLI